MIASGQIWVVACSNCLLAAGYALSMPFFAVYLSVQRGVPMEVTGAFLGFAVLCGAAANAIGGGFADSHGRRRVMLGALFFRAFFIFAMSGTVYFKLHYAWLMAFHVAGVFFGAFFGPASHAWVADNFSPRQRVKSFGLLRIGTNLGWAVGPALGGFLALKSYSLMFFMTGIVYFAAFFVVRSGVPETAVHRHEGAGLGSMVSALRDRRFLFLCLCSFLICAVMSQLVVGLSLYCVAYLGLTEKSVGLLFSLNGFIVVAFQHAVSRAMERFRISRAIAAGCVLYAAGYLMLGFSAGFYMAAAGVAVFTLGELMVSPGLHTLVANLSPSRIRGGYAGMAGLCQQAGSALGVFLGGAGMQHLAPLWPPVPWVFVAVLALTAGYGFSRFYYRLKEREDSAEKTGLENEQKEF